MSEQTRVTVMQVIRGRKALVTGAASGIGRAIAHALAREGAELFLIDIDAPALARVAEEVRQQGASVVTHVCDLADATAVSAAVQALQARWGALAILVNNAGITFYGPTETMSAAQWQRVMAVNLLAPIQLFRETFPLLVAAEEAHVVNVSSMFGAMPWRKAAAYQTSKHGLVGFTRALRAEYQRDRFGITAVCPGFVQTALLEGQKQAPAWLSTTPEVVAKKTLAAIRRNRGLVFVTWPAQLYWRLWRLAPGLVDWLLREGWRRKGKVGA
jgi:NAD(P)-dependent dehydrogenase (short-subunit alcohol dehydrogenase family)